MKSQMITPEIRQAIRQWYQDSKKSQDEIARMIGIQKSSVNGWINGEIKNIRPSNWEVLFPYIEKYLPQKTKMKIRENYGNVVQGIQLTAPAVSNEIGEIELKIIEFMKVMDIMDKVKILNFVDELAKGKG